MIKYIPFLLYIKNILLPYFEPLISLFNLFQETRNCPGFKINKFIKKKYKKYKRKVNILIVRDTSGSMCIADLRKVHKCLKRINMKNIKYGIVDVDFHIASIITWNIDISHVTHGMRGNGGTTYKPIFEFYENNKDSKIITPDLVIYITDLMCNDFPSDIPSFNVIWLCTESSLTSIIPPFGTTVFMKRSPKSKKKSAV